MQHLKPGRFFFGVDSTICVYLEETQQHIVLRLYVFLLTQSNQQQLQVFTQRLF